MPLFTNLTGPVGAGRITRGADVTNTRKALKALGYYDGDTDLEYNDARLDSSIRQFQRARGLREDGLLIPGGETEREINRSLNAGKEEPLPPALLGSLKVNLSGDVGSGRQSRTRDVRQV